MSNLQTHYRFKLNFEKVDKYTGAEKHHKDNQLQNSEPPCKIS